MNQHSAKFAKTPSTMSASFGCAAAAAASILIIRTPSILLGVLLILVALIGLLLRCRTPLLKRT